MNSHMRTKVTERGQITIPKAVRERLGIRPGQVLEVHERDGQIIATKTVPSDPLAAVRGVLRTDRRTDELIGEIRGEVDGV